MCVKYNQKCALMMLHFAWLTVAIQQMLVPFLSPSQRKETTNHIDGAPGDGATHVFGTVPGTGGRPAEHSHSLKQETEREREFRDPAFDFSTFS